MATDAEKVKMYREKAKDTSIPQEVRNTYLDRANELERKAYDASKGAAPASPPAKMAKGGAVKKAPAKAPAKAPMKKAMASGGVLMPSPTLNKPAPSKKTALANAAVPKQMVQAYMAQSTKPTKAPKLPKGYVYAKGGMAKKGKC